MAEIPRIKLLDPDYDDEEPNQSSAPASTARFRRISEARYTPLIEGSPLRRDSISDQFGFELSSGVQSHKMELVRARFKIQGHTLKEAGPCSVELWKTALEILVTARALLLRKLASKANGQKAVPWGERHGHGSRDDALHATELIADISLEDFPELSVVGISPYPKKPTVATRRSRSTTARSTSTSRSPSIPIDVTKESDDPMDRFPLHLWRRIIAHAVDPNGILSHKQQLAVIDWARTREHLHRGREVRGKPESAQVWRVLEATGCLAYDTRD
ncbi:MAG: hypothetical protein M1833_004500 [Piccolia ochrophora]|nr:MAG: hypothetical protein M1833_004500 [Piccolia ochrophora]